PQLDFDATFTINVYTPVLVQKAYNVLLFTTSVYHFFTISFIAKEEWVWQEPDIVEQNFARKYIIPFLLLGFFCMMLTVRGSSITENSYASPEFETGGGPLSSGGVELLSLFFLVFSLIYAIRGWGYLSSRYRCV